MLWIKIKQSKRGMEYRHTLTPSHRGETRLRRHLREGAMSTPGEAAFQQTQHLIFVLEEQGG